jgi:indole-3-glycerol phosphate synthase
MTLLDEILENKKAETASRKNSTPLEELKDRAKSRTTRSLRNALSAEGFGLIGEIKKKSPSMGGMRPENAARALEAYGRSGSIRALSILTDGRYFDGSLEDLSLARESVSKPILRKDFILEEYQVWEAKAYGADAILLMASVHEADPGKLRGLFDLAASLGLDALIEFGREAPPRKEFMPPGALLFGVNARVFKDSKRYRASRTRGDADGKDLTTDLKIHAELFASLEGLAPPGKILVAESGIRTPEDLGPLMDLGYQAALVGTAFLKKNDLPRTVGEFDGYLAARRAGHS